MTNALNSCAISARNFSVARVSLSATRSVFMLNPVENISGRQTSASGRGGFARSIVRTFA